MKRVLRPEERGPVSSLDRPGYIHEYKGEATKEMLKMKIDLAMSMKTMARAKHRAIDLAMLMKVRELRDNPGDDAGWASGIVGKRRRARKL
jgi:hypothetical protein